VQNPDSPYDVAALNNLYVSLSSNQPSPPVPVDAQASARPAEHGSELSAGQQQRLQAALRSLEELAVELHGEPAALLELLRQLEQLHRNLQDGAFRSSLPADRNTLFNLLQRMERSGGWPYIPRLQLRTFMDLLQRDRDDDHPLAA
jgi:hypothetical protein